MIETWTEKLEGNGWDVIRFYELWCLVGYLPADPSPWTGTLDIIHFCGKGNPPNREWTFCTSLEKTFLPVCIGCEEDPPQELIKWMKLLSLSRNYRMMPPWTNRFSYETR